MLKAWDGSRASILCLSIKSRVVEITAAPSSTFATSDEWRESHRSASAPAPEINSPQTLCLGYTPRSASSTFAVGTASLIASAEAHPAGPPPAMITSQLIAPMQSLPSGTDSELKSQPALHLFWQAFPASHRVYTHAALRPAHRAA